MKSPLLMFLLIFMVKIYSIGQNDIDLKKPRRMQVAIAPVSAFYLQYGFLTPIISKNNSIKNISAIGIEYIGSYSISRSILINSSFSINQTLPFELDIENTRYKIKGYSSSILF